MPKNLSNIDLNQNEIQNFVVQNLAAAPTSPAPKKGQKYFNTVSNREFYFNGTSWIGCDSVGATVTGADIEDAITASTVVTTVADADYIPVVKDSSKILTRLTWSYVKSILKTYFDTVYNNYVHPNHSGDVTSVADGVTTIANDAVTNPKLANMAVSTIKGRATAGTGDPEDLTGAQVKTLLSLVKADVGLGNVTNDAQVKKLASSTNGYIPVWNGTAGDALSAGYSVETALTGTSTAIPRADAVKSYVDALLASNDAMIFKGVIDCATSPNYPAANAGHSYKVSVGGSIGGVGGKIVEVNDTLMCTVDASANGTEATVGANWYVIQSNIDGAVIGPASALAANFAAFSGSTGKIIYDSGVGAGNFAPMSHVGGGGTQHANVIAAGAAGFMTGADKTKIDGIEASADVTDKENVEDAITASTAVTVVADADYIPVVKDTTKALTKLAWTNVKSILKTYFDTLYNMYTHPSGDGNLHVPSNGTTNSGKVLEASSVAGTYQWSYRTRKYVRSTVGDGAATSIVITHSLSTTGVVVSLMDNATNEEVVCDIVFNTTDTLTLIFAVAPALNAYTVTVIG